jgi:pyruvate formate lyase activating enzyme
MEFGGIEKTTLIDYPGRVAATIFLLGCNFRCPFCYSAELVLPEKIKEQPKISKKEILDFLKERRELLEGIVICGGEPTIHGKLPDFIRKIKDLGYSVKLDTNGSNPEMLKRLIDGKLIDYVAMDIKAPLGAKIQNSKFKIQKYERATGVKADLNKIRESIEIIKKSEIDYEFRTTVVPTFHSKEDIIQIARDISPAKKYYLQNFRAEKTLDPRFEKIKPFSGDFLSGIKEEISHLFDVCKIRD